MESGDQRTECRAACDHDGKARFEYRENPAIHCGPGVVFGFIKSNKVDDAEDACDYVAEQCRLVSLSSLVLDQNSGPDPDLYLQEPKRKDEAQTRFARFARFEVPYKGHRK